MLMKWMTKKEVMEATGISRYELDAAIKSGKLRYQMFKKRMKFTERDVELWQSNTMLPPAEHKPIYLTQY